MWFRLAKVQGRTFQEALRTNTSTEFVEWKHFLEEEANDFNPLFFYLAQIAACIERGQVKNPRKVKTEDKLLKFSRTDKKPIATKTKDPDTRLQLQKAAWFAAVGLKGVEP